MSAEFEKDVPIVHDFWEGVRAEKEHQRKRWGEAQDRNKTGADWFWLVGYLAGKALHATVVGDVAKAKHHTISTAAVLAMWHDSLSTPHDPSRASDLEKAIGERS